MRMSEAFGVAEPRPIDNPEHPLTLDLRRA